MANLQRDLKLVEESYGGDVLNLVVARDYLAKLFSNPTVASTSIAISPTSPANCVT